MILNECFLSLVCESNGTYQQWELVRRDRNLVNVIVIVGIEDGMSALAGRLTLVSVMTD